MDITHIVQPNSTASKTDPADVIMWASSTSSSAAAASQPHPGQGQPTTTSQSSNTPAFPGPLLVVDRDRDRDDNGDRQRTLLPATHTRTALLLIDIQRGLNTSNGYFGSDRATPTLEGNVATLLSRCREFNAHARVAEVNSTTTTTTTTSAYPIQMIHVFHQSSNPASPLHVSGRAQKDGIEFMPCAAPDESSAFETVLGTRANSAFADGRLKRLLAEKRIGQLVVVGIATDHCVSSSVRWAKDLGVVKRDWDRGSHGGGGGGVTSGEAEGEMDNEGTIVVVRDATACFGKGGVGAEMVQRVSLASLEGYGMVLYQWPVGRNEATVKELR
ncbi:isochorismatase [Cladophialophora carrionii]|uniref:Isochorismatase n=1 Tax=Cladophialophora carrionii TaxID=86049 RepID=A0A1C1CWX9_9EURO|nr:isochorismatase [Cladophialophora carrionii]